jgi:hypothetical protein
MSFSALRFVLLTFCAVFPSERSQSAPGLTEAAYSQPIYLDLSGPQTSEKFHFSIEIGTSF